MSSRIEDLTVFAAYLAIILLFIWLLRQFLGLPITLAGFFNEVRALARLEITPEALNGAGIVMISVLELVILGGLLSAPWRTAALWLIGARSPDSTEQPPLLAVAGMLLGIWAVVMIASQVFCIVHRRRVPRQ